MLIKCHQLSTSHLVWKATSSILHERDVILIRGSSAVDKTITACRSQSVGYHPCTMSPAQGDKVSLLKEHSRDL